MADLYEHVEAAFDRHGQPVDGTRIALHRGLFEDTLHPQGPVALAHVDSDWYDPVRTCLERVGPHVSPGGYVVLDDYFDYGGCRRAADEFLAADGSFEMARRGANVALRRVA